MNERTPAEEALHADFGHLRVAPGEIRPGERPELFRPELFRMINLIAFGGAADRPTHVPVEVGDVGPVVMWESTGAADSLPFWNTNFGSDQWLYIVDGGVRAQLKEPESTEILGEYVARTGDLFCLPKALAHRTFSLDGKRRITLEILGRDPAWATVGALADLAPAPSGDIGGFAFAVDGSSVVVAAGGRRAALPADMFMRGLRALVAWELHLGHNEFDGGFVVHDRGELVTLKVDGYAEDHPPAAVLAGFKALLRDLAP